MLASSDTPLAPAIRFFAELGIEAGFLVPTETGMAKSIMDAHESLRAWLRESGLHDFEQQAQGPENKVLLRADLIHVDARIEVGLALYRPKAKTGDPRIWPYRLGAQAVKPGNLLALVKLGVQHVAIINMSDKELLATADVASSPLGEVLRQAAAERDDAAAELLNKLRAISAKGWLDSLRAGDTGIGYTLETYLGIAANSSKAPDYKGIEIKASRSGRGVRAKTRVNLFSKIPDWSDSPITSASKLLGHLGYLSARTGRRELYCTVSNRPNSQGLRFESTDDHVECWVTSTPRVPTRRPLLMVRWGLRGLEQQLLAKHNSTFWVSADVRVVAGIEQFRFTRVVHSQRPLAANMGPLVGEGILTMDFTLSEKPGGLVRDHGYLFKIWPQDRYLLIPDARSYDLHVA